MPDVVNLHTIAEQLGAALGITTFGGEILFSLLFMAIFMFPTLFMCSKYNRNPAMPSVFVGLGTFGVCVAAGLLSPWFLIVAVFMVALLFAGKMKDIFT